MQTQIRSHWILTQVNLGQPTLFCGAGLGLAWHGSIGSHCNRFQDVPYSTQVNESCEWGVTDTFC